MNKKDLIVDKSSSEFLKQLAADINRRNKIDKNSALFIIDKKLQKYDLRKNFANDDLPSEVILGSVYLIKNNSIVEFYSHLTNDVVDVRFSQNPDPYYRCVVTIHNMNRSDICDFANTNMFENMDELISHSIDRTTNFLTTLIKTGFDLYLKK
jgi:hypothetical protein